MTVQEELRGLFTPGLNVVVGPPASGKTTIIRRVVRLYSNAYVWDSHLGSHSLEETVNDFDVVWVMEPGDLLLQPKRFIDLVQRSPDTIVMLEVTARLREGSRPVNSSLFHLARLILEVRRQSDSGGVVTVTKNSQGPSGLSYNFDFQEFVRKTLWAHLIDD